MFGKSPKTAVSKTAKRLRLSPGERPVAHCQTMLAGWDQERIEAARVCVVGAGGLGSEVALTLVQCGVGTIDLVDPDKVEPSNLNRQLFKPKQVGMNKADALAANVVEFGALGTTVHAYPTYVQEFLKGAVDVKFELFIVGVDNDHARLAASDFCLERGIPLVNIGLANDGTGFEILVQEKTGPCLRCWWGSREPQAAPCGGVPVDRTLAAMAAAVGCNAALARIGSKHDAPWTRAILFPRHMQSDSSAFASRCARCASADLRATASARRARERS